MTDRNLIVKLNFTEDENANVIFDSKNGVYTLFIESKSKLKKDFTKYKYLKFWEIPKTLILNKKSEDD